MGARNVLDRNACRFIFLVTGYAEQSAYELFCELAKVSRAQAIFSAVALFFHILIVRRITNSLDKAIAIVKPKVIARLKIKFFRVRTGA